MISPFRSRSDRGSVSGLKSRVNYLSEHSAPRMLFCREEYNDPTNRLQMLLRMPSHDSNAGSAQQYVLQRNRLYLLTPLLRGDASPARFNSQCWIVDSSPSVTDRVEMLSHWFSDALLLCQVNAHWAVYGETLLKINWTHTCTSFHSARLRRPLISCSQLRKSFVNEVQYESLHCGR